MARRIWEIDGTEKHLQELAGEGLVHSAEIREVAHPPAETAVQLQDQRHLDTPHREIPAGAGRCGLWVTGPEASGSICRGGAGIRFIVPRSNCRCSIPKLNPLCRLKDDVAQKHLQVPHS